MSEPRKLGPAGKLARFFVVSKLTPLLALFSLFVGALALWKLPREEEPQINVPMFDVLVPYPGASAREVEEQVVNVGERRLQEIPGVEYIYSTARPGQALFIVRFKVGTSPERAMTLIYTKTFSNVGQLPPGAGPPLIKPRSIDDVPILALTLWGGKTNGLELRRAAAELRQEIAAVGDVAEISIMGGRRRSFLVHFDPEKIAARRLSPSDLAGMIRASNARGGSGHYDQDGKVVEVDADAFIRSADDLRRLVLGVSGGRPVPLSAVATVEDGPDEEESGVFVVPGPSQEGVSAAPIPAVTIAVSKRRGANAAEVSREVLRRVEASRGKLLPPDVRLTVTRDYGRSAKDKSDELIFHLILATFSVTALLALALGMREGAVVLTAIPVTLALTLLFYYLVGYTLNRITLFALIFSIGILVDDAIVVVENIHRHQAMADGRSLTDLAVDAVNEVGNPTILATWTVIAAILPMAFVRGLMGPYMRPIPVGASAAMLFSLVVAFVVSPWAFRALLELWPVKHGEPSAVDRFLGRIYRRVMHLLIDTPGAAAGYFAVVAALFLVSVSLVFLKLVRVKMLPFDNKDEIEVVLDMPDGTDYKRTLAAATEIAERLREAPDIRQTTAYVGTAAPYNFNGLVRHYFFRTSPSQADLAVDLLPRGERKRQSHDIAKALRPVLHAIASRYGARLQVAEVPPGPPVLSTLVFEIYGPDAAKRDWFAGRLEELLKRSEGITDVGSYVSGAQPLDRLSVKRELATINGIPASEIVHVARLALAGETEGLAHVAREREPVEIRLRLPPALRTGLKPLLGVRLPSRSGAMLSLGKLTQTSSRRLDAAIYHKNLLGASYVLADVAGKEESPIYAILRLRSAIRRLARDSGLSLHEYFTEQPPDSRRWAIKWDGEWQITYEVFRDMGFAFAVVLVLIYLLVLAWFEDFVVPFIIMAPIPMTLIGILPAHAAMGAFFTATSMIGFIAGAGIVVRNSIIIGDFIELRLREGVPLKEASIAAGEVRFRPMLLTALAVVVGAGVILFDPIFQGLAVSLIAGELAAALLSWVSIPLLYYFYAKNFKFKGAKT